MPFHALGSARDQVWQTFTADGQPSEAKATTRLCHLDPEFFVCLQDSGFRYKARQTLVSIYFTPREQVMICARLGLPVPDTEAIEAMKLDADEFKARQKKGRDSRFTSTSTPDSGRMKRTSNGIGRSIGFESIVSPKRRHQSDKP